MCKNLVDVQDSVIALFALFMSFLNRIFELFMSFILWSLTQWSGAVNCMIVPVGGQGAEVIEVNCKHEVCLMSELESWL